MEIMKEIAHLKFQDEQDDETYNLDKVALLGFIVTKIHRGYFVYREEDHSLSFCFFMDADGHCEHENFGQPFWYGWGTTGSLRELRHSYFAEYVFYIPTKFIRECCDIMDTYFDEC